MYNPFYPKPFENILFGGAKTAFSRPFAAVFDLFFTAPVFSHPTAALLFYCGLYTASGIIFFILLKKITNKRNPFFLIFYLLLPTITEGTYWISAATRISAGMFFASLALFAMYKKNFFSFFVCFLFSLGFYEQTALLSFFLVFLLFLLSKKDYFKYFATAIFLLLIFVLYYMFFGTKSNNSHRIGFSSFDLKNIKNVFFSLLTLLTKVQLPLYVQGFLKGLKLSAQAGFFRLLILLTICFLFCKTNFLKDTSSKKYIKSAKFIFFGTIIFAVPLAPFFVIKNPWLNFRNLVPSVLGFSIIANEIFSLLPKGKRAVLFFLSFYLTICCISEIYDYRQTALYDEKIIFFTANQKPENDVFYFKKEKSDYLPQPSPYNDHIMSITGSDWGLSGAVRAVLKKSTPTVKAE